MNKEDIKIAVVGGGNIGKTFSTLLVSSGYDVELVCRDNHRAIKIDNAYAFDIQGDFGNKSYLVPFVTHVDDLSSKKDIIILATKSFDMLERVQGCIKHLTENGMIVTIQNICTLDKLFQLIPAENSVCMVCDFTSTTLKKMTYVYNSHGITLGVYDRNAIKKMNLLKDILNDIMPVHTTKDVVGFVMSRNILNTAISLLGAMSGLHLKDILKIRNGRKIFCRIIEESYLICKKYRINVLPYNNQLEYNKFVERSLSGWLYRRKIIKVLKVQNGNIKSSALEDIENGKPTEIRTVLDTLICYGKRAKLATPTLSAIDEILREVESRNRNIGSYILNDNRFKVAK